jgi:hypothetical protein
MAKRRKLYDVLGANESDDAETIKRHYRRRSKEAHPDKHPEKAEEFKAVSDAFLILSDPARRAKYDATGDASQIEHDPRRLALGVLSNVMQAIIASDLEAMRTTNQRQFVKDVRSTLDNAIREIESKLKAMRRQREVIADVADRISAEQGEENIMAVVARAPLRDIDMAIGQAEGELASHKEAWSIAGKHKFRADEKPQAATMKFTTGKGGTFTFSAWSP